MHREGDEVHVDEVEARAGGQGTQLLKMLLGGLALIAVLYGITLMIGIGTAPYVPEPAATDLAQ
jgi:hypothetical protein